MSSVENLRNRRVLLVEDEYVIAFDLASILEQRGVQVIGPFASAEQALGHLRGDRLVPDAALLDINLNGQLAYGLADVLMARGVPVLLLTGYGAAALPERLRALPMCDKPLDVRAIEVTLAKLIGAAR